MSRLSTEDVFPHKLAGVIRWNDAEQAYAAALVAARAGVGSIEITASTPQAFELIRRLKEELGSQCAVGAGTITSAALARQGVQSNADYLVTPYLVPEVAEVTGPSGLLLVMGATTPTEIARAVSAGADVVKVFPAAPIGGPAYIRAVRGPMPEVPFWVSGGVSIADIKEYLEAGVRVVGLTNDLFRPEILAQEDWAGLEGLCSAALAEAGVSAAALSA